MSNQPLEAARQASPATVNPLTAWGQPDTDDQGQHIELTPATVEGLLARACFVLGLPAKVFGPGVADVLAAISWDGHPQDLRAFIASLAQRVEALTISLQDVLAELQVVPRAAHAGATRAGAAAEPLRVARRRFERDYVKSVLEQHHYNVREAAAVLGIQRTNLYRKLKSLRLRTPIPD